MGYQLLVWDGPRPEDDAAAGIVCGELIRQYFVGNGFEPTASIRAFVEALTDRWPEDDEHLRSDESPWKFPPLLAEATGPALFLNLRFGVGERAAFVMAEMAEEHGLVAFDLYMEIMRPVPAEITDEIYRRWRAETFEMMAKYEQGLRPQR